MKKTLFFAGLLLLCFYLKSQSVSLSNSASGYIHCSKFFISKPMRDLPDYKPIAGVHKEAADRKRRNYKYKSPNFHPVNSYADPLIQSTQGAVTRSFAPIENWEATSDAEWDPGDPNGAVSADYYVQALNTTYTVWNKTGGLVLGPKDLDSNFWQIYPDNEGGDPVVLYDKFADRWFISEFQVTNVPNQLYVGVSQTNDPTGAFYVWVFTMNDTIYPDYPKYSIWTDGYYLTFQGFSNYSPNLLVPELVGVLERNRMLNGSPSAGLILAGIPHPPDLQGGNNALVSAPKTFDCDASALPPYGTPNYLVFFENTASGGYSNTIVMDKLVTDTTAHTLMVSKYDSFAVPYFNAYFTDGSYEDISQPGDANGVDALDGTFNFRVPYDVFTGYNSVVLSNTVNTGSLIAGIRWYELRQNQVSGSWVVYDSGTYAPNDGISRWNGAICEDYDGDIALEYSVSSSTLYPGIRYTGRLSTDPPGEMTFAEQTVIDGSSTLSGTGGRWGDYSQLDIDPSDGFTFWGTNQYGGSDNANGYTQQNRIWSFGFPGTGVPDVQEDATIFKAYQNSNNLVVIASNIPTGDMLSLDLFDITGRRISSQNITPQNGQFQTLINVSTLAKGVYFVRLGRMNFQRVVKVEIQ